MDETKSDDKKQSISEREEAVLALWKERNIFEKSLKQNEGKESYVFYDGPPFATGLPHHGHLLQGTIKDLIPRYQTMRGRYVRREWGWDCHGLPIENLIEKGLGKAGAESVAIPSFCKQKPEPVLPPHHRLVLTGLHGLNCPFIHQPHAPPSAASHRPLPWHLHARLLRASLGR